MNTVYIKLSTFLMICIDSGSPISCNFRMGKMQAYHKFVECYMHMSMHTKRVMDKSRDLLLVHVYYIGKLSPGHPD